MTKEDVNNDDDIRKIFGKHKGTSKVRKCFYENDSCDGKIIKAHSLSKSATLELIKSATLSGDQVLQLSDIQIIENQVILEPRLKGWQNQASIFTGFCEKHDKEIFNSIENGNEFNGSPEQNFAHSYRSFAVSYHNALENQNLAVSMNSETFEKLKPELDNLDGITELFKELEANCSELNIETDEEKKKLNDALELARSYMPIFSGVKDVLSSQIDEFNNAVSSKPKHTDLIYEPFKKELNLILTLKDYSQLNSFVKILPYKIPLATAGCFFPKLIEENDNNPQHYIHDNNPFNNSCIMVTVTPISFERTAIILSCFKKDSNSSYFLQKLKSLKDENELNRSISAIILNSCPDNTFMNPLMWKKICENNQDQTLLNEIKTQRPTDRLESRPYQSLVNLFDQKYCVE